MHGIVGTLRAPGDGADHRGRLRAARSGSPSRRRDIQALLGEHGFLTGVAGHASAGNLHFMLTPNFSEPADRERYEAFMDGLVDLIVDKYDGSLKAEHGTGDQHGAVRRARVGRRRRPS